MESESIPTVTPSAIPVTDDEKEFVNAVHPPPEEAKLVGEYQNMIAKFTQKPPAHLEQKPTSGKHVSAPPSSMTSTSSFGGDEEDYDEQEFPEFVPKPGEEGLYEEDEEDEDGREEEGEETESQLALITEAAKLKEQKDVFKIRPSLSEKFRPAPVRYWIEKSIKDIIGDQEYSATETSGWSNQIVQEILDKTKAMNFDRYKLVVQVVIGERKGQGLASAQRCLWDVDADCYATYTYLRDSLFCVGTVYAIYFY